MRTYQQVRIRNLVYEENPFHGLIEVTGFVQPTRWYIRRHDAQGKEGFSYIFVLHDQKQTSKFIFVEVKERTSIIRRNSRLERIAAKAWREMKPIRMRGEYDSSQPWEFVAEEAEIIDGNNGELSLYDATEQDGQLSLATGGGELSIAEE